MNKESGIRNIIHRLSALSHQLSGKPKAKSRKLRAGFTLIELMVSSTIFIIVMVIAIGAVLSIVDANRKAQSLNDVITNLNFAVESMVRDLREGSNYTQLGTNNITFKDSSGNFPVKYSIDNSHCLSSNQCITKTDSFGTISSITSSNVIIDTLTFDITSVTQPTILITLQGRAGIINLKTASDFKLQTLVTQRALGIQP